MKNHSSKFKILTFALWFYALIFSLFAFPSCLSRKEQPGLPLVVAMVNGKPIKEDTLRFRINLERIKDDEKIFENRERFDRLKREVLDRMIENRAVIDWGEKAGITLTPEDAAKGMENLKKGYTEQEFQWMLEEKNVPVTQWRAMAEETLWVQKILKQTLYPEVKATKNEIQAFYLSHLDDFREEEKVRVRQIVTDTYEKAERLHALLMGGENFARLAIMHSISPDRSSGGDLGFFARGTHPREFDDACFGLNIGEISQIVKSPYGYHIFKLIDRKPQGTRPLTKVLPRIEADLLQKKLGERYKAWRDGIMAQSQIQIVEDALKKIQP